MVVLKILICLLKENSFYSFSPFSGQWLCGRHMQDYVSAEFKTMYGIFWSRTALTPMSFVPGHWQGGRPNARRCLCWRTTTLTHLFFFPGHWFGGGYRIRQAMSPLEENSSDSPVPGHWLGGRHTVDDVSAIEQQLLLAFPSFQEIDLVEGIRQAMSPLFQDTDWVEDIRKTMSLRKNNNSYSFFFLSRTLIWWRVFDRQCLHSKKNSSYTNWLTGWRTYGNDVSAEELNSITPLPFFQDSDGGGYSTGNVFTRRRIALTSVPVPGCLSWIADPTFFHPVFQIRIFSIPDPHQRI